MFLFLCFISVKMFLCFLPNNPTLDCKSPMLSFHIKARGIATNEARTRVLDFEALSLSYVFLCCPPLNICQCLIPVQSCLCSPCHTAANCILTTLSRAPAGNQQQQAILRMGLQFSNGVYVTQGKSSASLISVIVKPYFVL